MRSACSVTGTCVRSWPFALAAASILLCVSNAQQDESNLVAQISTVPYDDHLHKGGLSFETKDGSAALQRRLLIASDGRIGVGIPDELDPSAMLDVRGDFLAKNGTMTDLYVANSISVTCPPLQRLDTLENSLCDFVAAQAHHNISGHHFMCHTMDVKEKVTISAAQVLDQLDTATLSAQTVNTNTATIASHLSVGSLNADIVLVGNQLNVTVLGADKIETKKIATIGIPFDKEWEKLDSDKHCSGSTLPVTLERGLESEDGCQAACYSDDSCVAVTWDSQLRLCRKKQGECFATAKQAGSSFSTFLKPEQSHLDMAAEVTAAKAQILHQKARIETLEARVDLLTERLDALLDKSSEPFPTLQKVAFSGDFDDLTNNEFHKVARSGSYADLVNQPTLNAIARKTGKLDYNNIHSVPAAIQEVQVLGPWEVDSTTELIAEHDRHNKPWPPVAKHACYLSGEWDRTSPVSEQRCIIHQHSDKWKLTSHPDLVTCYMHCIRWN